eukprot:scpid100998/ scgid2676/ 
MLTFSLRDIIFLSDDFSISPHKTRNFFSAWSENTVFPIFNKIYGKANTTKHYKARQHCKTRKQQGGKRKGGEPLVLTCRVNLFQFLLNFAHFQVLFRAFWC